MSYERHRVSSGVEWEELYGYSRAVRVGDTIYVAGTTATGPDGVVCPGDVAGQTRYAFEKVATALQQLGGRLEDVVRTRVFVADIADFEAAATVHGEVFRDIRPANTLVEAKLVGSEYLVEVEAVAVVDPASGQSE